MSKQVVASICLPGRPWRMNTALRDSWQTNAKKTKELREAAYWLWRANLGPSNGRKLPTHLTVNVRVRTQDKVLQDVGAAMPAVKAVVDGLVDTGWIEDDNPLQIYKMTFHYPITGHTKNETHIYLETLG